jgi:hypothetical protein
MVDTTELSGSADMAGPGNRIDQQATERGVRKLTRRRFEAARNFMAGCARPLEWSRFLWTFEDGSPDDVVTQLESYQNADGGFGHALEPDLRMPGSSVLATTIGLRILHRLRVGPEHEMVRAALRYLLDRWDEDLRAWPIVPPQAEQHPHPPWFDRTDDFVESWHGFQANPRAEVIGYLWIWDNIVPDDFLCRLCREAAAWLAEHTDDMEMHELLCYRRLVDHPILPAERRNSLLPDLRRAVGRLVEHNPENWNAYCLGPLDVAPGPHSPLADMVEDLVPRELDYLLETQQADGSWGPNWSWADRNPDAWERARREWTGIITLRNLRRLHAWGRLEGEEE